MAELANLDGMTESDTTPFRPDLPAVTATEAKNALGAVLDRVMVEGGVAITKHNEVKAVLLSVREYESLIADRNAPLADLAAEFDGLVERMQSPKARQAGRTLFDASPAKLGRAAVAARRGGG
jgi:prevent-host-death family protein